MKNLFTRSTEFESRRQFLYKIENPETEISTSPRGPIRKELANLLTEVGKNKVSNRPKQPVAAKKGLEDEISASVEHVLDEFDESGERDESPGAQIHKETKRQVAEKQEEGNKALVEDALSTPTNDFLAATEEAANNIGGWEQFAA